MRPTPLTSPLPTRVIQHMTLQMLGTGKRPRTAFILTHKPLASSPVHLAPLASLGSWRVGGLVHRRSGWRWQRWHGAYAPLSGWVLGNEAVKVENGDAMTREKQEK